MKIRTILTMALILAAINVAANALSADEKAKAKITGLTEGSTISGTVEFTSTEGGLKIDAAIEGVQPGKHGFHIHEYGSCDDAGKAAGGHYNPIHVTHGFLPTDGPEHAHSGDMGNIEINEDGRGTLSVELPGVTLSEILGRALILHEKEDDFGQPTGNAGERIACGIIGTVENK